MPRSAKKTATTATATKSTKAATSREKQTTMKTNQQSKTSRSRPATAEEEEENDDEEEESASVVERPAKRTKREAPTATSSSKKSSRRTKNTDEDESMENKGNGEREEEEKKGKEEKEEDDVTMHHRGGRRSQVGLTSPLTQITVQKYGRIFASALQQNTELKENKQRQQQPSQLAKENKQQHQHQHPTLPALPSVLTYSICDFISIIDLTLTLASVSRSAYATVRDYGESIVQSELQKSVNQDPLGEELDFTTLREGKHVLSSSAAVGSHRLGRRMISEMILINDSTSDLLHSQLRHCITSLTIAGQKIDLGQVNVVTAAMPNLRAFAIKDLKATQKKYELELPTNLRSLSVNFNVRGWSEVAAHQWLDRVCSAISSLQYLNEFRLINNYMYRASNTWVKTIARAPRLRIFYSRMVDLITQKEQLDAFPATLTSLSPVDDISYQPIEPQLFGLLREIAQSPNDVATLLPFQLRILDIRCEMKAAYAAPFLAFASSLTALDCLFWATDQVKWLRHFTALRSLIINTATSTLTHSRLSSIESVIVTCDKRVTDVHKINLPDLTETLVGLKTLTRLNLFVLRLEESDLGRILRALTSLQHLGIGSSGIKSVACFSENQHLTHQLHTLILRLPYLPRNEVVHLYPLKWLSKLDIAGSFTEPLYARQLVNLQPPKLPYLRTFVPRTENEPVPIPPVDLEVQAAERSEFNDRVRSGQVCAAEMINSDQLTLILQLLGCKEFSYAGRTCRSWRSAASQKSAWSSGNAGRTLVLEGDAPECVPSILPQLPLWRYARRASFYLDRQHPLTPPSRGSNPPPSRLLERESLADPLKALALMSRLESLDLHGHRRRPAQPTAVRNALVLECMNVIQDRLLAFRIFAHASAQVGDQMPAQWLKEKQLPRVKELDLHFMGEFAFPEWSSLTQLHSLTATRLQQGMGESFRLLSLDHQLRHIELDLTHSAFVQGRDPLTRFLRELIHHPQLTPRPFIMPTATYVAQPTMMTSEEVAAVIANPQPAVVETLCLRLAGAGAELDALMDLPRLTSLRVEAGQHVAQQQNWGGGQNWGVQQQQIADTSFWNFAQFPQRKDAFQALERFHYAGTIQPTLLIHLAHLNQLRSFTLIDEVYMKQTRAGVANRSWTRQNSIAIPSECITKWIDAWTELEDFHLEGLSVDGEELEGFARAKKLRSFRLHYVQTALEVADFAFLTSLPQLESVQLVCILGLTLLPRVWFDYRQQQYIVDRDIEMKSDDVDLNTTSLIEILRSCSQLRQLTWCLHPTELDLSVECTQRKIGGRGGLWDRREREWARERYALKTLLQNTTALLSLALYHHRFVSIRYMSCCEDTSTSTPKRQRWSWFKPQPTIQLTVAEETVTIDSAVPLDPSDRDFISHQEELARLALKEKKSRKRKVDVPDLADSE